MFRSLFETIFREVFYEACITKTTKPKYKHKMLNFKCMIPIYVKMYNTDKIVCAEFMCVRSVHVLCVCVCVCVFVCVCVCVCV